MDGAVEQRQPGTVLSFPNLTSITGPVTPNTYFGLIAQYNNGATLSLPALTTVTKADDGDTSANSGVRFYANDGTISAPNFSSFRDNDNHPNSSLRTDNQGVLSLPKLLAPKGLNININSLSHPEQFTSLVGTGSFEVTGGTAVMSNLNSIVGISSITADYGAQLSFPNVTSFTVPVGANVTWTAQSSNGNQGTVLSFPNLTSITGPVTPNTYFDLIAQYNNGATLSLPALTTITKADDGDQYNDSGVRFYANSGTISAPNLSNFQDNDSHPNSSIGVYNGGAAVLTSLALSGIRGVTLTGLTLPATILSVPVVSVVKTGGSIKLTVQTVTGHTYQLQQTSALNPANWQNVGSSQTGSGGSLDFTTTTQGTTQFYRITISP